jgi:hypothetical protein
MDVRPVIVIIHAAFDEARRQSLTRLVSQLRLEAPGIPFLIAEDHERIGCLRNWRRGMEMGLESGATHIVSLPDDAIICEDFGVIIQACIEARPDDILEGYVNHVALRHGILPTCWYSTSDGFTGVCGVLPRDLLARHLSWRDSLPELGDYPNDAGVNLWAIASGRLIYKTAWSLVQHDQRLPSLVGNQEQADEGHVRDGLRPVANVRHGVQTDVRNFLGRTFMASEGAVPGRKLSCLDLGPTYKSNMFDAVRLLPPATWDLYRTYRACHPPIAGEHVVIVVPVYHEPEAILRKTRPSREAVKALLEEAGVMCTIFEMPGDSHVDRMRQRATHQALRAGATRLLWWDADLEARDPSCVLTMLRSGHDVVAGACPFKDTSGKVVCNIREQDERVFRGEPGTVDLVDGMLEVQDAGTGFMMVSRAALLRMFQAYPERCHLSRSIGDRGEPLWAIWDAAVLGAETGSWAEMLASRVFATEDYHFCRLWQQLGGKVYVHVPSTFRHYGLHGFEGSFEAQWGLTRAG